jgi:hypothetical protein
VGVVVLALVVPAAPAVVNLARTERAFAPADHPRWLGDRYLVADDGGVRVAGDPDGVASVVATLAAWGGRAVPERADAPDAAAPSVEAELAVALGSLGYHGAWAPSNRSRLADLALPFVAIVDAEASPTPVLVARVIAGHVFAFDPRVGSVLFRPQDWSRAWSGRAFVFDEAPPAPRAWR